MKIGSNVKNPVLEPIASWVLTRSLYFSACPLYNRWAILFTCFRVMLDIQAQIITLTVIVIMLVCLKFFPFGGACMNFGTYSVATVPRIWIYLMQGVPGLV